jgi:hypothetical protein
MSPTPPTICGIFLVLMTGAGLGHFLSVQELVSNFPAVPAMRVVPPEPAPKEVTAPIRNELAVAPVPQAGDAQKEFFEGLLSEVRALRNENRNLIDQVAETNRDMMQMGFRLDTHSASFRPLPTSEDRDRGDISSTPDDDFPGVLPPRASPVYQLDE